MEEDYYEETPEDRSYRMEMTQDAIDKIAPTGEDLPFELASIGHLAGKRPEIQDVYGAKLVAEIAFAGMENRDINWDGFKRGKDPKRMDPGEWFEEHALSVGGKRAAQIVEVAKATQIDSTRRGLFGKIGAFLFGR